MITAKEYPANGIEFIASDPNTNALLAGRIYFIGNRMYMLMAETENDFDNDTSIFLDSLSLF